MRRPSSGRSCCRARTANWPGAGRAVFIAHMKHSAMRDGRPGLRCTPSRLQDTHGGNMHVQRRGAAIEIVGLRKEYGRDAGAVVALADIDLSVKPGEFVAIGGPGRCATSTLLRILAGPDRA